MMLQARTNKYLQTILDDQTRIESLVAEHGSPLNVLLPTNFSKNIQSFQSVLDSQPCQYQIYYAHKSSTSQIFLEQSLRDGIGIDVASEEELQHALDVGCPSDRIEATGPKSRYFLSECIKHGVLINVDSFSELDTIRELYQELNISAPITILVRLSGFADTRRSRFGIEVKRVPEIITYLKEYKHIFAFKGLSFHTDDGLKEKLLILEEFVRVSQQFLKAGLRVSVLDIGGGFMVSYLADGKQWDQYLIALKNELLPQQPEMTWRKNSYGFSVKNGLVFGSGTIHTPYRALFGSAFLQKLLSTPLPSLGVSFAQYLRENFITLALEPGRGLHDLAGFTITQVMATKEIDGHHMVIVDRNTYSFGWHHTDMFVDPIHYPQTPIVDSDEGFYIAGNLCLEDDFVSKHKVFIGALPQVGDLLVFVNTSGYYMNFYQNNAISHSATKEIVIE